MNLASLVTVGPAIVGIVAAARKLLPTTGPLAVDGKPKVLALAAIAAMGVLVLEGAQLSPWLSIVRDALLAGAWAFGGFSTVDRLGTAIGAESPGMTNALATLAQTFLQVGAPPAPATAGPTEPRPSPGAASKVAGVLAVVALPFVTSGCSASQERAEAAAATAGADACQFVEVADPVLGLLGTFCSTVLEGVATDLTADAAAQTADAGAAGDAGAPRAVAAGASAPSPRAVVRAKLSAGAQRSVPHGSLLTYVDATGREVAHVWPGVQAAADELLRGRAARRGAS